MRFGILVPQKMAYILSHDLSSCPKTQHSTSASPLVLCTWPVLMEFRPFISDLYSVTRPLFHALYSLYSAPTLDHNQLRQIISQLVLPSQSIFQFLANQHKASLESMGVSVKVVIILHYCIDILHVHWMVIV